MTREECRGCDRHKTDTLKGAMIRDVVRRHPELVQDLLRMAAIHAMIHIMMSAEGSESFFNRDAIALLLYTCLGVLFYHLLAKLVFGGGIAAGTKVNLNTKNEVVKP